MVRKTAKAVTFYTFYDIATTLVSLTVYHQIPVYVNIYSLTVIFIICNSDKRESLNVFSRLGSLLYKITRSIIGSCIIPDVCREIQVCFREFRQAYPYYIRQIWFLPPRRQDLGFRPRGWLQQSFRQKRYYPPCRRNYSKQQTSDFQSPLPL